MNIVSFSLKIGKYLISFKFKLQMSKKKKLFGLFVFKYELLMYSIL